MSVGNVCGSEFETIYITIETACFYVYMLATVAYIAYRMLSSAWFGNPRDASDSNKLITDFIEYSENNLTWFAFNFVLCLLPPICLYVVSPGFTKMYTQHADQTNGFDLIYFVYATWALHIV